MLHRIEFDTLDWESPMTGMRFKAVRHGSQQLRLVEYTEEMVPHWCERGHVGSILAGRFRIEFPDHTFTFNPGDGVFIPSGHAHRHRARVVNGPVRALFVEEV